MPKVFDTARSNGAAEAIIGRAMKLEKRRDGQAPRLCQPVLSEYELWREAAVQRRAFAKRLKTS
jgi:hypothetical protein